MIYHPTTPLEAVTLRKQNADTAVYLAGGTDDLRLNGSAQGKGSYRHKRLGSGRYFRAGWQALHRRPLHL